MNISVMVNFWAVFVAAIASMVVGSLWYGPMFGKQFMHASGLNKLSPEEKAEMKKGMTMTYIWQFIASLVMFYVFAWLMGALGAVTVMGGIQAAFWVWFGFMVPLKLGDALWGGKMMMFWLSIGNLFVTLMVGAIIIGAWH